MKALLIILIFFSLNYLLGGTPFLFSTIEKINESALTGFVLR